MPLMSCWTKTSMRPPLPSRAPLVIRHLNQSVNRGPERRQRPMTRLVSRAASVHVGGKAQQSAPEKAAATEERDEPRKAGGCDRGERPPLHRTGLHRVAARRA